MSDLATDPNTLVKMRVTRRYSHYTAGDVIAVPMLTAQDLAMRRFATPLAIMTPMKPDASEESKPGRSDPSAGAGGAQVTRCMPPCVSCSRARQVSR